MSLPPPEFLKISELAPLWREVVWASLLINDYNVRQELYFQIIHTSISASLEQIRRMNNRN